MSFERERSRHDMGKVFGVFALALCLCWICLKRACRQLRLMHVCDGLKVRHSFIHGDGRQVAGYKIFHFYIPIYMCMNAFCNFVVHSYVRGYTRPLGSYSRGRTQIESGCVSKIGQ